LSRLRPPFLKDLAWREPPTDRTAYPFSLPCLADDGFRRVFEAPITVLAGENGSGKSTLLEAIADQLGLGHKQAALNRPPCLCARHPSNHEGRPHPSPFDKLGGLRIRVRYRTVSTIFPI